MTLTLLGEPRSTNHVWKHSCRNGYMHSYMTDEGRALKEDYQWQAKAQWHGKSLTGPLQVGIVLYHGTKRRTDIDNFGKVLLDSLTGIAWEDDSQIVEMNVRKEYDKQKPRVEILINELP